MKLIEAQQLLNASGASGLPLSTHYLATGFTPLHYGTLLAAHLQQLAPDRHIRLEAGLYGDLEGNLDRMNRSKVESGVVHLEWSDLDVRLGLRQLEGWTQQALPDILESITDLLPRLKAKISAAPCHVTVVPPTLPVPPILSSKPAQLGVWQARLNVVMAECISRLAELPNVSVLQLDSVHDLPLPNCRRNVSLELRSGYPYTMAHADALAAAVAKLTLPALPLKGLITDLDNTLWEGILGEDGVHGVHWELDRGSQMHALYQQFLASLADAGVLIAIASKNDERLVERVLQRSDLRIPARKIFPVVGGWDAKSKSVARILQAWNIGPEAVAFVDDSPLDIAEVQARYPAMRCLHFPAGDAAKIFQLVTTLRDMCGRSSVRREDTLRMDSLRQRASFEEDMRNEAAKSRDILESAQAQMVLSWKKEPPESRALELINKTNQFNLNGRRYTAASWTSYLSDSDAFLVTAAYRDKFGELGRISAMLGRNSANGICIDAWVMSCRAFSRRIEHRMLRELFNQPGVQQIWFNFKPTDRNGPLCEFLESIIQAKPDGPFVLERAKFEERCPSLHQQLVSEAEMQQMA